MLLQSALLALSASLAAAVPVLEAKGNVFVNPKTGNRFQIVGVAYQPGGASGYDPTVPDVLSVKENCIRDAALLQVLGVNAIRIYNLNPNQNHDECASIFNAAGMYMLIDVNSPLVAESLTSFEPWTSYYAAYLNRTFAIVEAFKNYPNTLAFFSGNEVMNNEETAATVPPYSRAVTRDIKEYISKHSSRPIPVGYSAADVRDILFDSFQYFQCAEDGDKNDMSHADLFALNSYSWCGTSSFKESSYNDLVSGFTGSSVPIFYSEYGCNTPSPRIFQEVATIYGPQMTDVFSGGIVYEYTQEDNKYGLVKLDKDGSVTLLQDFVAFKDQLAKVDFKTLQSQKPSGPAPPAPKCDAKLIKTKGFNGNFTLPVLPPGAKEIIDGGVSPAPSGKTVSVSSLKVTQKIKNPDGTFLVDLAITQVGDDEFNLPGTNPTKITGGSTKTPTGTTDGPATTSSNAAVKPINVGLPAAALGAFALVAGMI
ncbi:glycoside hydrolase family 72 protein [Schizothecium vesticola]|uniref:1,3-beta-glucanosyltransferase n=1 Tax=Schizothecium vesticola TaxID=314040 RepID=A0AA40EJL2_9PEZI|nr:glycoside hydrolase family 72 protein [Schizothecium vesticola]